jgi:DNA-binding response OmpR family regulator
VEIIRVFTYTVVAGSSAGNNGAATMMRILVVEDETRLAHRLVRILSGEGYAAETVGDGRSALALALVEPFDLLIVDWMLPDLDGIQVVRRPILMLTARGQIEDRVTGLDAGADDYLPKPFAVTELLARVRALARWPREEEKTDSVLRVGDVSLDPIRHAVWRAEEPVALSAKEFALLATFMRRPQQVFTRSVLLDSVWGGHDDNYGNVVDLYVSYLRKKLDREGERSHIRTVRGVGYTFDPQPRQ